MRVRKIPGRVPGCFWNTSQVNGELFLPHQAPANPLQTWPYNIFVPLEKGLTFNTRRCCRWHGTTHNTQVILLYFYRGKSNSDFCPDCTTCPSYNVSYPSHGGTIHVRYWLVHFKVIFPDLWGHWQSKWIGQHHCVRLFDWMTCERSRRNN